MGKLKHLVLAGASLLAQGYTDFDSWSEKMIQEFGPAIAPHLEDIMLNAREVHGFYADERPAQSPKRGGRLFMAKNVLIVDDEPNIILSLKFLMTQEGFEVRTASNGEESLKALAEQVPDLILLDVMMPRPDGYEVCQKIRATPEWKDIPVIMLTAKGRDVEKEKGLAMGADDYITKPFATRELVAKVHAILKEKKR
jgi:CheY-like chemotaxis protein